VAQWLVDPKTAPVPSADSIIRRATRPPEPSSPRGPATKVTLTVHSVPEGATVSQNGQTFGATPLTVSYEFPDFKTCHLTEALTVTWASGASSAMPINLCPAVGKKQQFSFARPTDAPNLALDWQVAYQQAALAQLWALAQASGDPAPPAYVPFVAPPHAVICTTRHVANGVDNVWCQ
jgi:hypothetical protein